MKKKYNFRRLLGYIPILLVAVIWLSGSSVYGQSTVTEVISSGSSWTVPCGVTAVDIEVYGAGGAGGGSNTGGAPGGAGGAGGYSFYDDMPVTAGTNISFTLGVGGTGGCAGSNGTSGTATIVTYGAITIIANGGSFGSGDDAPGNSAGGAGGTASGGTANASGGDGNPGDLSGGVLGGSGGSNPGPSGGGSAPGGAAGLNGANGLSIGGGGAGSGDKNGGSNPCGGNGANGGIVITYTTTVTTPSVGSNLEVCSANLPAVMTANAPDLGWTGTWTVTSGAATISNINDPNASISGISPGSCATLQWEFTNGSCVPFTDELTICVPVVCNDNPCNATAIPSLSTSCSSITLNLTGATTTTGEFEPACGSWSASATEDLWYSATVPASGTLILEASDTPGGTTSDPGIAVYQGSCDDLMHAGCDYTLSSTTPAQLYYTGTPGSTVYIRVWDYNDGTNENIDLCAYTLPNVFGSIEPGAAGNTITCGSTSTFMDPGGSGNYPDETTAFYTICPDTPGEYVTVDFSSFSLVNLDDYLTVIDGAGTIDPIIGNYTGTTNPGVITSSNDDGCLSFMFRSDNLSNAAGWLADVYCSSTPGTNTVICTSTNCSGECGQWVCADGLYPTENQGTSSVEEITYQTGGCWLGAGEISTKWFYFTALTTGSIEITFDGPAGQDYDFAVWGPTTDGEPPCPSNTGESPIRCSYSAAANPVGIGGGATDLYEDAGGDGWVAPLDVIAGETYVLALNIFQNGNPQPTIDISFGGSGELDCTPTFPPLLAVELIDFRGINQGAKNLITWFTETELDNAYFTLESSPDGVSWREIAKIEGAGTSSAMLMYNFTDYDIFDPVTFYRLSQTDFDGKVEFNEPIKVISDMRDNSIVSDPYPNPTDQFFLMEYLGNGGSAPLQLNVYNALGQKVYFAEFAAVVEGSTLQLDVSYLENGIYNIELVQGTTSEVHKISIIK